MPGSNNGTGCRITARCFHCAKRFHVHNLGYKLTVTGERRAHEKRAVGIRHDYRFKYQIRCRSCGRLGWSRHIDVAQQWQRKYGEGVTA